mgnify:CR=1 FL=1
MDLQVDRVDTDRIIIAAVPPTMIPLIWDKVEPEILKPIKLSHGEVTLESAKHRLETGQSMLITVSRGTKILAVNTVEVREFESGVRTLAIPLIGGSEMDQWMDRFLEIVKAIAKDLNCTELRGVAARKGWMRVLRNKGWEELSTIVKCNVGE